MVHWFHPPPANSVLLKTPNLSKLTPTIVNKKLHAEIEIAFVLLNNHHRPELFPHPREPLAESNVSPLFYQLTRWASVTQWWLAPLFEPGSLQTDPHWSIGLVFNWCPQPHTLTKKRVAEAQTSPISQRRSVIRTSSHLRHWLWKQTWKRKESNLTDLHLEYSHQRCEWTWRKKFTRVYVRLWMP